ncbi:MAG: carbohydrate-binding domain-containing protein [Oscillospiraceae bacterium]|nr:carbohydrate-binding domain-containing protein [Oscillospiraceae bacterium]
MKRAYLLLMAAALTACSVDAPPADTSSVAPTDTVMTDNEAGGSADTSVSEPLEQTNDKDETDIRVNAVITLSDNIRVSGTGASAVGNVLTIEKGGSYEISGRLTGQIIVDISKDEEAEIILIGADVTAPSEYGSALWVKSADKVTVKMKKNTVNTFSDAPNDSGADACIYSEDDLDFKGSGALVVNGNNKNGIYSKNDIKIKNGVIKVTAVKDGIKGRQSVQTAADVTVVASGDGIVSNGSEKKNMEGLVTVSGGSVDITAEGTSSKGIKSSGLIVITGGSISISATDDALHCDGEITVDGGELSLSADDDGIHASALTLNSGKGSITKSHEGIEAVSITVNGGEWYVAADDDGVNATDGSSDTGDFMGGFDRDRNSVDGEWHDKFNAPEWDGDLPAMPDDATGMPTRSSRSDNMPFADASAVPDNVFISITGGVLNVDAGGDGIDSNGNIMMSGGELYVNGPVDDGNASVDYDGTFTLTGGTLAAAGSSGMAQTASSSEQGVLCIYFKSAQKAGTEIAVKNNDGVVARFKPKKSFSFITLSSQDMNDGEYTVYADGAQLCTVNISGITSINERGETVSPAGFGRGRMFGR